MSVVTAATTSERRAFEPTSPVARRPVRTPWRDPKLILGVALVAVSVVVGARVLAAADDSVAVWAARSDLPAGATLEPSDLVPVDIRFSDADAADRYLSAAAPVPEAAQVSRPVGAGELLPRAALGAENAPTLVEVPLAVAAEAVPATVRAGAVVDVWVTPKPDSVQETLEAVRVFDDVVVVAAPRTGTAFGPAATRQVIVGIDAGRQDELGRSLALAASGAVVLTRQG